MNEEEREIVKKFEKLYLKDFNNEKITNEDKLSYIECALMTNLIEKLQKENEELKKDYYNVINKIENKIDILDIAISECIYIDDDDKAYKKAVKKDKLCLLNQKRALQELLDGSDTDVGSIGSEN